ncbi:hypothetical protein EBQ26_01345 [Allofranklinella schreckenbergeri]|uniref:DUF5666 domain-containing protein n=1 Tax=Allofranklinella schreckenbergeri TaxID=1076744 RepID=A0A3M6QEA0_9BURK|nr:DUF5666 domain-containing protein [Allofranklinella schreckenbergeri]RMX01446.1 hypothetical protein EBQ26_01345 [Allofranklinella schreckenbergeri]RMX01665.1 hypothetical protein EBQ25_03120 [Allofranklinella schreckenbergeri]RRD43974.1 hypothetical protein EII18_01635 [Comamonadaceae bacterium OH3737_COT-264]
MRFSLQRFSPKQPAIALAGVLLAACATTASFAETLKGRVDVANQSNQTLVVAGITFQTTTETAYGGALKSFATLQAGQKVSVEFDRSGSNVYTAKKISLLE